MCFIVEVPTHACTQQSMAAGPSTMAQDPTPSISEDPYYLEPMEKGKWLIIRFMFFAYTRDNSNIITKSSLLSAECLPLCLTPYLWSFFQAAGKLAHSQWSLLRGVLLTSFLEGPYPEMTGQHIRPPLNHHLTQSILGNAYIMNSWPHVLYLLQLTKELVMKTLHYGANTSEFKIIL